MFNHSSTPNVSFSRRAPTAKYPDVQPAVLFKTARPIKAGDELCICYSADESKLWFSPNYGHSGSNGGVGSSLAGGQGELDGGLFLGAEGQDEKRTAKAGPSRMADAAESMPVLPNVLDLDKRDEQQLARQLNRSGARLEKRKKMMERVERKALKSEVVLGSPETNFLDGSSEPGFDRESSGQDTTGQPKSPLGPILSPTPLPFLISIKSAPETLVPTLSSESFTSTQTTPATPPPSHRHQQTIASIHDEGYTTALAELHMVDSLPLSDDSVKAEEEIMSAEVKEGKEATAWREITRIRGPVEEADVDADAKSKFPFLRTFNIYAA